MKTTYWILTIQETGSVSSRTIWYEGSIATYLLIERQLGRDTNILYSQEISETEYEYAKRESKK